MGVDKPHSGSSEIAVYPNPVADQLFFQVQVERPITLRATLFDLTGKRVRQVPEFKVLESYQGQIDMSDLPAGEWLLRFEREDQMVLQTLRVTKLR